MLQLLIQLPQELNTLLVPHLPLLLHTCVVCYGPEAQSVLQASDEISNLSLDIPTHMHLMLSNAWQGVPNGVRHAQVQATALLRALLRNLAPRAHPLPPTNKQGVTLFKSFNLICLLPVLSFHCCLLHL